MIKLVKLKIILEIFVLCATHATSLPCLTGEKVVTSFAKGHMSSSRKKLESHFITLLQLFIFFPSSAVIFQTTININI